MPDGTTNPGPTDPVVDEAEVEEGREVAEEEEEEVAVVADEPLAEEHSLILSK